MDDSRYVAVTGASRGLGLHIAERALESGYKVLGFARNIPEENYGFPVIPCDVGDAQAVRNAFRNLRGKKLWALINAAGLAAMNLFLLTPATTMEHLVRVNLLGTMYASAEAGRLMARHKQGRIINFSSIAVPLALKGEAAYVASKAGVEGFTRAFAREMGEFGVTVNAIAPGPVPTNLIAGVSEEKIAALIQRQIIPRQACLDDVWHIAEWLLGEAGAMTSGQVFSVGGV
jgi:3-oxoacyl-[acyl-carrier protein] reductase